MEQWQTTLIGTLSGFVTGLLLEPIKFHLAAKLRRSALRSDMYDHLGRICYALARYESLAKDLPQRATDPLFDPKTSLFEVSTDLFDYALDKDKVAFYGLPECSAFKLLYQKIRQVREAVDTAVDGEKLLTLIRDFNSDVGRLTTEKILNPTRLDQGIRNHRRQLAARVNSYYRR